MEQPDLNIVLITSDPVPKFGSGGPGAVITNLIKGLTEIKQKENLVNLHIFCASGYGASSNLSCSRGVFSRIISRDPLVFTLTLFLHDNLIVKKRAKRLLDSINTGNIIVHAHDVFSLSAFLSLRKSINSTCVFLSVHSAGSTVSEMARKWSTARTFPIFKKLSLEIIRCIELRAIKNADRLILPSMAAFNLLANDYSIVSVKKFSIVNNGISPLRGKSGAFRKEIGISSEDVLVVSIGNLVTEKGFDVLIKAIKLIGKNSKKVYAAIAGIGPLKNMLQGLINSLGVSERVFLLGFRSDISNILADADIFVSSSRFSAFDLSILEAMSIGLPVIATRIGGNPEAIKDTGILVAPDDSFAISNSILDIASNEELKHSLSLKTKKLYEETYGVNSMSSHYLNIYEANVKDERK